MKTPLLKSPLRFILLLVLVAGALTSLAFSPSAQTGNPEDVSFPNSTLNILVTVSDRTIVRHPLNVEVATTPQQLARGLMYRDSLPAGSGMLFLFDKPHIIRMWMRNTRIPLDMLFVAPDGTIVDIATNTVPFSEETIAPRAPASAVIEVNAGSAERAGIHVGDRVEYEAFTKNQPQ